MYKKQYFTINLCLNFFRLEYRVDEKDIYQVVTDHIILEKGNLDDFIEHMITI